MKNYIKGLWFEAGWFGKFLVLATVLLVLSVPYSIYISIKEEIAWQKFMVKHNCKLVGHTDSSTKLVNSFGITGNGQFASLITPVTTPEVNSYLCDDGVTYNRNN